MTCTVGSNLHLPVTIQIPMPNFALNVTIAFFLSSFFSFLLDISRPIRLPKQFPERKIKGERKGFKILAATVRAFHISNHLLGAIRKKEKKTEQPLLLLLLICLLFISHFISFMLNPFDTHQILQKTAL